MCGADVGSVFDLPVQFGNRLGKGGPAEENDMFDEAHDAYS